MKTIDNEMFTFRPGTYSFMNTKLSPYGATVILKRPSSTTHINFDDISEAIDTIKDHISKYDTKVKLDAMQDEYLNSEAGAWGRSGT